MLLQHAPLKHRAFPRPLAERVPLLSANPLARAPLLLHLPGAMGNDCQILTASVPDAGDKRSTQPQCRSCTAPDGAVDPSLDWEAAPTVLCLAQDECGDRGISQSPKLTRALHQRVPNLAAAPLHVLEQALLEEELSARSQMVPHCLCLASRPGQPACCPGGRRSAVHVPPRWQGVGVGGQWRTPWRRWCRGQGAAVGWCGGDGQGTPAGAAVGRWSVQPHLVCSANSVHLESSTTSSCRCVCKAAANFPPVLQLLVRAMNMHVSRCAGLAQSWGQRCVVIKML